MTVTPDTRAELAALATDGAAAKGMLSAGYVEVRGGSTGTLTLTASEIASLRKLPTAELQATLRDRCMYSAYTQVQCSMTVRHPKGIGSGWAGASGFDWKQLDTPALANLALDKCMKSIDPVRIEPGRYTVILEPQAVADLVDILMLGNDGRNFDRRETEAGRGPFFLDRDPILGISRTKLGLRIMDERITIAHDPMEVGLGIPPNPGLAPVTWIERGVLQALTYKRGYAAQRLNEGMPILERIAYRMSGGTTPVSEMISTTKRGLLVTRFSNLKMLEGASLLATGVTRDGLWLIENGQISKAVKNMRITESPLFVLNQIEQLGVPVPVFRPVRDPFSAQLTPAITPPLKARDFSFTATIDAV